MSGKESVLKLAQAYTDRWEPTVSRQLEHLGIDRASAIAAARRHVVDIRPSASSGSASAPPPQVAPKPPRAE